MFLMSHEISMDDPVSIKIPVLIRAMGAVSAHEVELRTSKSGKQYYMFYYKDGTCVTNYSKQEYEELKKIIPIEDETIFLFDSGDIWPINEAYRDLVRK